MARTGLLIVEGLTCDKVKIYSTDRSCIAFAHLMQGIKGCLSIPTNSGNSQSDQTSSAILTFPGTFASFSCPGEKDGAVRVRVLATLTLNVLILLKQAKSEPQGLVPADDVLFFTIKLKIVSTKSPLLYVRIRATPSFQKQPGNDWPAGWPKPRQMARTELLIMSV